MSELNNPLSLPHHTAVHLLAAAERSVLADHAFGDSEVDWYMGNERIAQGYFSMRSSSVAFLPEVLQKLAYSTGHFSGEEARTLEYLGTLTDFERNDMQGNSSYY